MAGSSSDQQKQFLTLIRGFATQNSQGERRIVDLKKRIEELRSAIVASNSELEDAKRLKESTEQEVRGYEVEFAMNEASIQTLEARICLIQDEVSTAGSNLEALKNEEGAMRDNFIEKMKELNAKIRNFQKTRANAFNEENCSGTSKDEAGSSCDNVGDAEVARKIQEHKLAQIISETKEEEQEYHAEQVLYKQVQQELIELEGKLSLMEALLKENKELQEVTRPKQTSESEQTCASLGSELQKRALCPSCHIDNVDALGGILRAVGGS